MHGLLLRRAVPKVLLRAFVDVNVENNDSVRPLQMACVYGDLDTLRILFLSKIVNIDDEDNEGDTALQQAAMGNHTDCVGFLVEKKSRTKRPEPFWQSCITQRSIVWDQGVPANIIG